VGENKSRIIKIETLEDRMIKILLINESETNRKAIREMLAKAKLDADIAVADTVREALKQIGKKEFDCIILDNHLPGKDGIKSLQQLFESNRGDIPAVIMVSEVDDNNLALQCLRAGAQDFILRESIAPEFLKRSIVCAIERKSLIDQRLRMESKFWETQQEEAVNRANSSLAQEFESLWSSLQLALKPLGYESLTKTGAKTYNLVSELADKGVELAKELVLLSDDTETIDKPEEANFLINDAKLFLQNVLGEYKTLDFKPIPRRRSIYIHKGLFKKAMLNLVKNAAEAMQAGGVCTISILESDVYENDIPPVEGMPAGQYIGFLVSDTGHGMSEDILEKAADKGFTTRQRRKATGVGLSQVKELIKRSRGFMKLESHPGEGTKVYMYFPLLKDSQE